MYLGLVGFPDLTNFKKAFTRAMAQELRFWSGRWDVEKAPAPRRYTAFNLASVTLRPLGAFSLCSFTFFSKDFVIAAVKFTPLPSAAEPSLFFLEPLIRSFLGAGLEPAVAVNPMTS